MENSSGASRSIMAPTVTVSTFGSSTNSSQAVHHNSPNAVTNSTTTLVMKPPTGPPESLTSITAHRRKRLVRSENVCCSHHQGWEAIFRESLLHMAWPISMSLSSDQTDSLAMTDFLPLKIRSGIFDSIFFYTFLFKSDEFDFLPFQPIMSFTSISLRCPWQQIHHLPRHDQPFPFPYVFRAD